MCPTDHYTTLYSVKLSIIFACVMLVISTHLCNNSYSESTTVPLKVPENMLNEDFVKLSKEDI